MSNPPAESITDFESLFPRQVGRTDYRVLSLGGDHPTAYEVDVADLTCTCKDETYRGDGPRQCKHVSMALFQHTEQLDVSDYTNAHLSSLVDRAQEAARSIEDVRDVAQASQSANASQAVAGDDETETEQGVSDPVAAFETWLEGQGLDPDDFRVWVDEQFGSLQIDQDGYLSDGDFSTWVEAKEDTPLRYDQDNDINYIKAEDFGEVLG
jgi:hypothetical protein